MNGNKVILISFDMDYVHSNWLRSDPGSTIERTLFPENIVMNFMKLYPTVIDPALIYPSPGLLYSITTPEIDLTTGIRITNSYQFSVLGYLTDSSCDMEIFQWSS